MVFRNDIQGLRAIAVLFVFIFHLNSAYLGGGFIGVDIFFVISGFLISSIILGKKEKGSFNLLEFYKGRVKRIVPAYVFFLLIIFLLGCFIYFPTDIKGLRNGIFHSLIFNSNNYLASLDTYFGATSSENPILHTWTLAIEMQFYFILPVLLLVVNKKFLPYLLVFLIVILFGYSYYNSTFLSDKNGMYFSLLARMPEFLIGTLASVKSDFLYVKNEKARELLSIITVAILFIVAFIIDENSNFPGIIVVLPCIAVSFILINPNTYLNEKILSNKLLVHIGELSYSIYLWHWGFMALLRYHNFSYNFTLLETLLLIILTYFVSFLSYKYIEINFRKMNDNSFLKIISLPLIFVAISTFAVPAINNKIYVIPKKYSNATFGLKSHSDTFKTAERFGDLSKSNDSILLIGDSFALLYKHVLHNIGKQHQFNFLTITNDGTPLIPGINRDDFGSEKTFQRYSKLIKESNKLVKESKVILIASSWRNKDIKSLPEAFRRFAQSLRPDQKLIVLSNFPSLDKNPIKVNRGFIKIPTADNNYKLRTRKFPTELVDCKKYPNVFFMDEVDYSLYKNDIPFYNDTVMYYDADHLNIIGTGFFSTKIEESFIKQFRKIVRN